MSRSSGLEPAGTLSPDRIRLCGRLAVALGGREVSLRGRQARLVVAYLAWNRRRPVSRDELIELLWPSHAPASPDDVLSALLSKVRAALGPGALEGRRELSLALPADTWIDVEAAAAHLDRAEAAFEDEDWAEALRAGSLAGVTAATDALDDYGEHYTAARLKADALLRLDDAEAAEATAARLRAMGALGTAAELSGTRSG